MYVLHAHWQHTDDPIAPGAVVFWSESTERVTLPKTTRRVKSQLHPFCADSQTVADLIHRLTGLTPQLETTSIALLLPTTATGPQPSPLLLHDWVTTPGGELFLAPWQIPGVRVTLPQALQIWLALPGSQELPLTVRLGDDLRFWSAAATLVLEALAQHKIIPTLVRGDGRTSTASARWQPVLDGPKDGPRLARLAEAMPPLCRSGVARVEEALPPRQLLEEFLNGLTDQLMRQWGQKQKPALTYTQQEPAHQWLRALFGEEQRLRELSAAQLERLRTSQQAWLRNLYLAGDKQVRVAFRLETPVATDNATPPTWHLHFLLQARDDPSLLVPAQQVWQSQGVLRALNRQFEHPQETLLTGLGYAARIAARLFPPLHAGLSTSRPDHVALSTQEAYDFLRTVAPLLEESGFGVLVPPWWNQASARLGVRLRMRPRAGSSGEGVAAGVVSLEKLVNYRWDLSLGGTTLTREEFDALVALKAPLVQIRGQWVQLDAAQIEAAIRFWERHAHEDEASLHEALQLGLGGETVDGLPVEAAEFEGWLHDWMARFTGQETLTPQPQPAQLQAQLRPYQLYGYSWLDFLRRWGMGACLADDMGLGKCLAPDSLVFVNGELRTAQALWETHATHLQFDGEGEWAIPNQPLLVNALDEMHGRIVTTPIQRLYRQPVCETVRTITLKDGSKITITGRHQLLTDKGWTNQLHAGDYVCVPAKLHWAGQPADPDLVKLLAWQIAKGHERTNQARLLITQKRVACLQDLLQTFQTVGQRYGLNINRPGIVVAAGKTPALRINSQAYRAFLEAQGYAWGKLSAQKSIPSLILQANDEGVALFLRHYFDAEASVVTSMRSIEISSASSLLMQQLSTLLRRFGIWLRIAEKQKRATNGSGLYRPYWIGTLGGNAARRFFQTIGFGDPEKQQRLAGICAQENNTNVEGIPASDVVAQAVKRSGLTVRHFGMHNTIYLDGSQQFSRSSLQRVITHMERILSGEAEQHYRQQKPSKWTTQTLSAYAQLDRPQLSLTKQQLERLADQEVFYCQISAIEEVAYEGWVYDFEVAKHHNFVANQILCHNTIQTLAMLLRVQEQQGALPGPVLLIAPTSVVTNWAKELERFAPSLRFLVHQGQERLRGDAFVEQARQSELVLTSYPLVRRDAETLGQVDWFGVTVDEAQNIKNPETKQARTIRQLPAGFRLALTGTPVENRLGELWSIMHFLNPGFLGSQQSFRKRFALPIEQQGDEAATQQLRRMVSPFILRRVKTDPAVIQDLPEKQESKVYCLLSEEQATLYEAVVQEALSEIAQSDGIERKGLVLSMLMKLKQICNHPAQFLHQVAEGYTPNGDANRSGKLARLDELLEEILAVGERTLIFTQFAQMGHLLKSYLPHRLGVQTLFLHGGTPTRQRTAMIEQFQAESDGPPIFILSLRAGGTGLNLTRANHVFHFDRWWNPAVEDQATDRAFRIGQTRNVQVHKFVCVGTLEERIDEMIERKKSLAQSVVGSGESWLTELSSNELRDLVTLRRSALQEDER